MKRLLKSASLMMLLAMGCVAGDFLPLAPGNQWTYQDSVTGQSFTVHVGVTQYFLNQHVYQMLHGYAPDKLLVRTNEYGNIVYWDQERETDLMLTSFEIVPGAWFQAYARVP